MTFRLKILLGCHGNEDFNFKFYIFTVYNMRMAWPKSCLAGMQIYTGNIYYVYFFWSIVDVSQKNIQHLRRYFVYNIMRNYFRVFA